MPVRVRPPAHVGIKLQEVIFDCENVDKKLLQSGLHLEYFTVGYNILEGLVSIFIGFMSSSIALTAFGLDSFIESFSGAILIWRFREELKDDHNHADDEHLENSALRYVGMTFFVLAAYVAVESSNKLLRREIPQSTVIGILIAVLSIAVMTWLSYRKIQLAKLLNSKSLLADSKETLICICLSFILLFGLLLNRLFSWWWADPAAALFMCVILVKEGFHAFHESREHEAHDR